MSVFLANIQKVANIRHPLTLSLMSPSLRSLFLSPSLYLSSLSIHSPSISLSLHALREKRLSPIVADVVAADHCKWSGYDGACATTRRFREGDREDRRMSGGVAGVGIRQREVKVDSNGNGRE